MDFGLLPPEINSGRMYAGPGAGPLLAAAAAWDGLAVDLHATAVAYHAVIAELTTGPWLGPSSARMVGAAAPYLGWLHDTAERAEGAAMQAQAAVAAYEAAHTMTVPPSVIAANRAQLAGLIATNVLGQNTPAIAATEADYGEMWARDSAAMYMYAGASASASKVTPFTPPPTTTNGAARSGHQTLPVSTIVSALRQLASPSSESLSTTREALDSISGHARTASSAANSVLSGVGLGKPVNVSGATTAAGVPGLGPAVGTAVPPGWSVPVSSGGAAMSAAVGKAASVGALSVPRSWGAAVPETASAIASPGGWGVPVSGAMGAPVMPVAGMAARGAGRAAYAARVTLRPSVIPRSPLGG